MFVIFRFPNVKNPKMCPPPGKRSTKSDDYQESESLGVLGMDYDLNLHYAVAHMRRIDGALPVHVATGRKQLDFLAGKGKIRYDLC